MGDGEGFVNFQWVWSLWPSGTEVEVDAARPFSIPTAAAQDEEKCTWTLMIYSKIIHTLYFANRITSATDIISVSYTHLTLPTTPYV